MYSKNPPNIMSPIRLLILSLAIGVLFIWQSMDSHLYWHEVRFLYASTQFSMNELFSGVFNPHQMGGPIDEIGAGGFYLAKALHIWLLKQLFIHMDPAFGGFTLASWISVLLIGCIMAAAYFLMKRIVDKEIDPLLALFCFVMAPVIPYLAGKILSEITSLLFVTLSILIFTMNLENKSGRFILGSTVCGALLVLAGFCRLDMTIAFFGFLISAILICPGNMNRRKIIQSGSVVTIFFILVYLTTLYYIEVDPYMLTVYFQNFYNLNVKSILMSFFGILSFGGLVYLFAILSVFSENRKTSLFFATWLVLTVSPMIIITMNYMVEPRYLASSILPLCGLGAMGLEWIKNNINWFNKQNMIFVTVGIVMIANTLIIKLMPYELDKSSILKAVNEIKEQKKDAFILVPWAYSDFNFLHIMAKGINIYNVNAPNGSLDSVTNDWKKRIRQWYGDSYIDNNAALRRLLFKGSGFYLGWRKYPPIEILGNFLENIGLKKLARFMESLPFKNHLTESWVWNSPKYHLEFAGKCGQYEYYEVLKASKHKA